MPKCPRCGAEMVGGAPHGPWPVQYECPKCRFILVPSGPRKEFRVVSLRRSLLFNIIYDRLSTLGACDAVGSAEWQRVFREWQAAGELAGLVRFIIDHANAGPADTAANLG